MKRFFLFLMASFFVLGGLKAQNVQVHYDFGRTMYEKDQPNRPQLTATVEGFHPDAYGDTFWFVDFGWINSQSSAAMWKILRTFRLGKDLPVRLQLRYDGGLFFFNAPKDEKERANARWGKPYGDAVMVGPSFQIHSRDFSFVWCINPLYKVNFNNPVDKWGNFEFHTNWNYTFASGKFSTGGFFSFWREVARFGQYHVVSQPNFWCYLNKFDGISKNFKLAIGTEIRISSNVEAKKTFVCPTLGLKWTF